MYGGPDFDVVHEGPSVSSAPSQSNTADCKNPAQPTINEVNALVARFKKDWKIQSFVVALGQTGCVHRTVWSHGETRITEEDLERINRWLSKHLDGQILADRKYFQFARNGASQPVN